MEILGSNAGIPGWDRRYGRQRRDGQAGGYRMGFPTPPPYRLFLAIRFLPHML